MSDPPVDGGSSPRAWGTLIAECQRLINKRFIPTGVGNTLVFSACVFLLSVHPHGRGEHSAADTEGALLAGSSPRAWGTQPRMWPYEKNRRFIPTGVGNTKFVPSQ